MKTETLKWIAIILYVLSITPILKSLNSNSPLILETEIAIAITLIPATLITTYIYFKGKKEEKDEQTNSTKTSN